MFGSFAGAIIVPSGLVWYISEMDLPSREERIKMYAEIVELRRADMIRIFPFVEPSALDRLEALGVIAPFASERGLKPVDDYHARIFFQPCGIINWCLDLDLLTGRFVRYGGTHAKAAVELASTADAVSLKQLRDKLALTFLATIPRERRKSGCDGASVFLEVQWGDDYVWLCHWSPDENPQLREVTNAFSSLIMASKGAIIPATLEELD
jgi:hypothetical protein